MKLRHWKVKCLIQNYAIIWVITRPEPYNSVLSVFPNALRRANSFHYTWKCWSIGIGYLGYYVNNTSEIFSRFNSKECHDTFVTSAMMDMRDGSSNDDLRRGYWTGWLRKVWDAQLAVNNQTSSEKSQEFLRILYWKPKGDNFVSFNCPQNKDIN